MIVNAIMRRPLLFLFLVNRFYYFFQEWKIRSYVEKQSIHKSIASLPQKTLRICYYSMVFYSLIYTEFLHDDCNNNGMLRR